MCRNTGVSWITFCIVFIFVIGSLTPITDFDDNDLPSTLIVSEPERGVAKLAGTPHAPIVIVSDANFSATALAEGWIGNGSSGNPYIIEGLDIDRNDESGHCISISNTRINFTIRNCNLTYASIGSSAGIYIRNVTYGLLEGNTFQNNYHNIYISDSSFITIYNSTCFNSFDHSIVLDDSSYSHIASNNCSNSGGVALGLTSGCSYNKIVENTFNSITMDALLLDGSYNIADNNTCNGNVYGITTAGTFNNATGNDCINNEYGIDLIGTYCLVANNICNISTYGIMADGAYNTIANNTCNDNSVGIFTAPGDFNTFIDNTCNSNGYGFYLGGHSHIIVNNTCSNNIASGILLSGSSDCKLSENFCEGSNTGIYLDGSSNNNLSNNECNNNDYGILVYDDSTSNIVTNNTCFDNDRALRFSSTANSNNMTWNNLIDSVIDNCVDQGVSNIVDYNYWSDYSGIDANSDAIGDTPYVFSGNNDPHPLMYPNTMVQLVECPSVHTIEYTQKYEFDFDSTSAAPESWAVNNTEYFSIDNEGILISKWILPVGIYGVQVTVSNVYGQRVSLDYQIHVVVDAQNPPEWIFVPTDQFLAYNENLDYQVAVIDPSGISRWILNDTSLFNFEASFYSEGSTVRIRNNSFLSPGSYGLNIIVYDNYENWLSASFTVIVATIVDSTPPAWVTLQISQTIEYGEPLQLQVEAWDEAGVDHFWLNDTAHFNLEGAGIITNATILEPGIYRLEVRAYDPSDNYCSAIFVLAVLEVPDTITTTTTTTTTTTIVSTTTTQTSALTTTPLDGLFPIVTFALGIGLGGGIAVIAVLVMSRKLKLNG